MENFEKLLTSIGMLPGIIAITRTRLKDAINSGFRLEEYSLEYHESPTNAEGEVRLVKDRLDDKSA